MGEVLATIIFKYMQYSLENDINKKIDRSVLKGILERLFLFLSLVYNFPQALIAFSAIKIGARFIPDAETKISNDYFFIGNITSLTLSIIYFAIWRAII